ncbi:c-type cytochrome [Roseovarius aestuariivivens]|uniref:c-type cytochrome n=1 Tax=Roseovarius aestuariivivens TaxID=1888910 RepID=UPI003CC9D0CF
MTDGDMTEIAAPAAEEPVADAAASEDATSEEPASEEAAAEETAPAEEEMAAAEDTGAEAEEEPAAEAEPAADEASGFAAMVAAADPADGEKVYRQCAACHVVDDTVNRVGPHLNGVVGRDIGSVDGFNYSDALASHGGVWDVDALNAWLENSNDYIPGNKMSYRGLRDEADRAAVIRYMQSVAE